MNAVSKVEAKTPASTPRDSEVMIVTCTHARLNVTRKKLQWRGYTVTIMTHTISKVTLLAEKIRANDDE